MLDIEVYEKNAEKKRKIFQDLKLQFLFSQKVSK